MQLTDSGRILSATLELDWAVRCGLQVRWEDVSYREFVRLRLLTEERSKKELEDVDRNREKQDRERAWEQRQRLGK